MIDKLKPFLDRVTEARADYSAALGQIMDDARAAGIEPSSIVGDLAFGAWLREKNRPIGSVYFAKVNDANIVKIGFSTSVADRMRALQGSHGRKFDVLGTVQGSVDDERWFHAMFWWCRDRTLKGNEFFAYRPIAGLLRIFLNVADTFPFPTEHRKETREWVDRVHRVAGDKHPDRDAMLRFVGDFFDKKAAESIQPRKVA